MPRPSKAQLKEWFASPGPVSNLREQIRHSPTTPVFLDAMREVVPDVMEIPLLTYTLYREFERTGQRRSYQTPYFLRRAKLTRAVMEFILGDKQVRDAIHDLAWSICEETSWVLPAHEEQGPDYWELHPARVRTEPFGAHTSLTREPDAIDLFAAETGAALAETVYLVGDDLMPEVRQRIRHEVARHIFKPYLAHGRDHWWFKGALNWNGVCNGAIGLAFLRLEDDLETRAEALSLVLEGFEAYIASGFEADGGSIEGVGYWNYGLMYYVALAELLREITRGELDLLAQPRLRDIAKYPPGITLVAPNRFINFGDATESLSLSAGVVNRLAERTGVSELRSLLSLSESARDLEAETRSKTEVVIAQSANYYSKLPIVQRLVAWWDYSQPTSPFEQRDFFLPDCGVIKLVGQTAEGKPVILAAKAGHNDGHHSHADVGHFIVNVDGESLIPDAGRGLYSKAYFRQERYANLFTNSYSHNVPRIGGQLQAPGPEFGGRREFHGTILEHGQRGGHKYAVIQFHKAYDLQDLRRARRTLELDTKTGVVTLADAFEFAAPLAVEEAFTTWSAVEAKGNTARIRGERSTLELHIIEPAGVVFAAESLEDACRANLLDGVLTRLSVALPDGAARFVMRMTPG